jgi:hypothetical protein
MEVVYYALDITVTAFPVKLFPNNNDSSRERVENYQVMPTLASIVYTLLDDPSFEYVPNAYKRTNAYPDGVWQLTIPHDEVTIYYTVDGATFSESGLSTTDYVIYREVNTNMVEGSATYAVNTTGMVGWADYSFGTSPGDDDLLMRTTPVSGTESGTFTLSSHDKIYFNLYPTDTAYLFTLTTLSLNVTNSVPEFTFSNSVDTYLEVNNLSTYPIVLYRKYLFLKDRLQEFIPYGNGTLTSDAFNDVLIDLPSSYSLWLFNEGANLETNLELAYDSSSPGTPTVVDVYNGDGNYIGRGTDTQLVVTGDVYYNVGTYFNYVSFDTGAYVNIGTSTDNATSTHTVTTLLRLPSDLVINSGSLYSLFKCNLTNTYFGIYNNNGVYSIGYYTTGGTRYRMKVINNFSALLSEWKVIQFSITGGGTSFSLHIDGVDNGTSYLLGSVYSTATDLAVARLGENPYDLVEFIKFTTNVSASYADIYNYFNYKYALHNL